MTKLSIRILTLLTLALGFNANADDRYHPNHLFVKIKKGELLIKSPLIVGSKKIINRLYLVQTTNPEALGNELTKSGTVEYIQKDYYSGKRLMPKHEPFDPISEKIKSFTQLDFDRFNDPEVNKLWAFNESAGLDVFKAYDSLPHWTPEEVIVAVIDTGVDHNHDDLKDVMWVNKDETPGDGIDNDNNGYIDDIHGINTLVRDAKGRATGNTMASHWHGTHVSGTIAAAQNNHIGIAGVAFNARIMAIRSVPDDSDELDSNIAEALNYAAKMGAKVINCSFGKAKNEGGMVVRDVINEIGKKGVIVVASAGNDSAGPFSWHNNDTSPKFPASFDSENLLVIASTTSAGKLSSFSNIGKTTVDVASPGSNILSTIPGNRYSMASGTSMAAPNASGVVALVRGYYPDLDVQSLKAVLKESVTKVPSFEDKMAFGGRLNLYRALTVAGKE